MSLAALPATAHTPSRSWSAEEVGVLYAFARSGGTLVNQLLGSHPDALVLSEVNPAASCKPLTEQAQSWPKLIDPEGLAAVARLGYGAQIAHVHELSRRQGKRLLVKDWSTVNFMPGAAGVSVQPSGLLEQPIYLRQADLVPRGFVVCRRAMAVYDSMRSHLEPFADLDLMAFAQAYARFADAVRELPRVHLEDLQHKPGLALPTINTLAGLCGGHEAAQLSRWADFERCTTDNARSPQHAAGTSPLLPMASRPTAPSSMDQPLGQAQALIRQADEWLGYE
jgi:hypothetical protein